MNLPNLRFPDFKGSWIKIKIKETVSAILDNRGKNPPYYVEQGIPVIDNYLIKNQRYLDVSQAKRFIDATLVEEFIRKEIKENDLLITLVGNGMGSVTLVPAEHCVIIQNTLGYRFKETFHPVFMLYIFQHNHRNFKVLNRKMAQPNLKQPDVNDLIITLPTTKEEQVKIADFFTFIDSKIQLQQEKIDLLKEQKKGYMQKIFSQELRFKDENGQEFPGWSKVKLGKLTKKTGKKISKGIKYPVAAISNKKGFTLEGERNNSNADVDIKSYKLVKFNEFAYNPSRINVGSFGFQNVADVAIVSSLYVIFETLPELENAFLKMYMHSIYFNQQVKKNTKGSVREYLFYENFSNIKIPLPCIEEQQKISSFMDTFDLKINLAEQKLEQLMQQKQAFMQQMFI